MKTLPFVFALLLATPAWAQTPDCSLSPAGWETNVPLTAAADAGKLDSAQLALGKAHLVSLSAAGAVRFVTPPERAIDRDLHGGMVRVTIPAPGNYRVGLSSGAWIDVLKDDAPVTSTAHGHGEGCVRKMVTFPLTPGRHVIQLSGNRENSLRLMVWRQE